VYLSELTRHLQKDRLKPVYVAFGNNPQEVHEALDALRARAARDGDPSLSIVEFPRDQRELAVVMDVLQGTPMFVDYRMVILQGADDFLSRHRAALENYLNRPSSTAVLVLTVDSWRRDTKLAKIVEKQGAPVGCWLPRSQRDVLDWIQRRARSEHKKRITSDAAQLLADLCQNDPSALAAEIGKLALYAGQSDQISAQDVAAAAMGYASYKPFDLCDKLAEGDLHHALRVVETLLEEGLPAVVFIGTLRSYFRRLLEARLAAESLGLQAAVNRVSNYPKEREALARQLPRFSADHLVSAHQAILRADLEAKTSRFPDHLVLERLLMQLMPPAAPHRHGPQTLTEETK